MKDKTLVLGASLKPTRYSNLAISKLVKHDQPTVAIGLRKGVVDGVEIKTEMYPFESVDTITLYLNAHRQKDYYDYIVSLSPNRVIFNPGTENPELYQLLDQQGIFYENACTLVMLSSKQY